MLVSQNLDFDIIGYNNVLFLWGHKKEATVTKSHKSRKMKERAGRDSTMQALRMRVPSLESRRAAGPRGPPAPSVRDSAHLAHTPAHTRRISGPPPRRMLSRAADDMLVAKGNCDSGPNPFHRSAEPQSCEATCQTLPLTSK